MTAGGTMPVCNGGAGGSLAATGGGGGTTNVVGETTGGGGGATGGADCSVPTEGGLGLVAESGLSLGASGERVPVASPVGGGLDAGLDMRWSDRPARTLASTGASATGSVLVLGLVRQAASAITPASSREK